MYTKFEDNRKKIASEVIVPDVNNWQDFKFSFEGVEYVIGETTIADFCKKSNFDIDLSEKLKPNHLRYVDLAKDDWNNKCNVLLKIMNNGQEIKEIGECTILGVYCYSWSSKDYDKFIPKVGFTEYITLGKLVALSDMSSKNLVYADGNFDYYTMKYRDGNKICEVVINIKCMCIEAIRIELININTSTDIVQA